MSAETDELNITFEAWLGKDELNDKINATCGAGKKIVLTGSPTHPFVIEMSVFPLDWSHDSPTFIDDGIHMFKWDRVTDTFEVKGETFSEAEIIRMLDLLAFS